MLRWSAVPCSLQVLVGKEKDPATGEVPVADARESAPRSGLHVTSRTCGYRMLGAGGMYTDAEERKELYQLEFLL